MMVLLLVGQMGIHGIEAREHFNGLQSFQAGPTVEALRGRSQVNKLVYGFYPYWMSDAFQSLDYELLSHVAWFALDLDSSGTVVDYNGWPGSWAELVDSCHEHGVKVHMTATCFSGSDINRIVHYHKEACAHNIVLAAVSGGADGVNIDFEMPYSSDSLAFLDFIRVISDSCQARNLELVLCVGAVNWNNRFLVDRIAPEVDGLFIMGYDYFWAGASTTGPNAPLRGYTYNVTRSVDYYVSESQDPAKIILGVPYYGFKWRADGPDPGDSTLATGTALTYSTAIDQAQSYGLLWHDFSATPWFRYYSSDWYQTWFDNDSSIGLKYDLALDRDIAGVGIWALGYDGSKTELWDQIESHFFFANATVNLQSVPGGLDSAQVLCYANRSDSVVQGFWHGTGSFDITVHKRDTYDLVFRASGWNSAFLSDVPLSRDTFLGTVFVHGRDTEYIIDNTDPECYFSGSWITSEMTRPYWGRNYSWTTGSGLASALFMPDHIDSARYKIFIRFTPGSNRASDVPVLVHGLDRDTVLTVDQRSDTGWVLLTEMVLGPGSYLRVDNSISDPSKVLVVDAVDFMRSDARVLEPGPAGQKSLVFLPKQRVLLVDPGPGTGVLRIYDSLGRVVVSRTIEGRTRLQLHELGAGVYFAVMEGISLKFLIPFSSKP